MSVNIDTCIYRVKPLPSDTLPADTADSTTIFNAAGPNFAVPLATDGYAWWYVDASSDCGRYGLTLIAMLGCVFSPWYARARRLGPTHPLEHSACNLALYGPGSRWWAMTERGHSAVTREPHHLRLGPSALHWHNGELQIEINEITAPWRKPLQGRLRLQPGKLFTQPLTLDAEGRHRWLPIAAHSRITVEWQTPALQWQGSAYFDGNHGDRPLERDFAAWQWSRLHDKSDSWIFYDTEWRSGPGKSLAMRLGEDGRVDNIIAPPRQDLPTTAWGISRTVRCDLHARPKLLRTLENGPFYARSLLETSISGRRLQAWHESVSLRRFAARWVQALLPVRLPRAAD